MGAGAGLLHLVEDTQHHGESDALAGEGGCLPPTRTPHWATPSLSQHRCPGQDGVWPQRPAFCLLSWCSWTLRVISGCFLPAVCNTASVVGGIVGHSVRMLEQVQLHPDLGTEDVSLQALGWVQGLGRGCV